MMGIKNRKQLNKEDTAREETLKEPASREKKSLSATESGEDSPGSDAPNPENKNTETAASASADLPKKKHGWIIPAVIVTAAILLILLTAIIHYQKPEVKVMRALYRTVTDNDLLKALSPQEYLSDGSYKANFSFSASSTGVSFGADYSQDAKNKQQSFVGTANIALARVEIEEYYDVENVLLTAPGLTGKVYRYDYWNGSLGDARSIFKLDEEREKALSDLLEALSEVRWRQKKDPLSPGGVFGKWFMKLDFEKAEPAEFEVYGRVRNCKGYTVTIDTEDLRILREALVGERGSDRGRIEEDLITLGVPDVLQLLGKRAGSSDAFSGGRYSFYLWRGRLAGLVIDRSTGVTEYSFRGGDYPAQNMEIKTNGNVFEIRGSRKEKREVAEIYKNNESAGNVVYDYGDGSLDININEHALSFKVTRDGKKWKLSTAVPLIIKGAPLTGSLSFEKEPQVIRPSQGEVVDITEFNEEAITEMKSAIRSVMEGESPDR